MKAATASSAQVGARTQSYIQFWTKFLSTLKAKHSDWTRAVPPSGNGCWMSSKHNGVGYLSVFAASDIIRQDVNIDRPTFAESHAIFEVLHDRRSEIEDRYGSALEWDAIDSRKLCRVSDQRSGDVNRVDEHDDYIAFFVDSSERLRLAIGPVLAEAVASADRARDE